MIKLAVLFGGRSAEHEISIITALQMIEAMDTLKYDITPVYIDQNGFWYVGRELLDKSIYKSFSSYKSRLKRVVLLPQPGEPGLKILGSKSDYISIELYFLSFHGQYGEDGCVQGLMEMADVVYTGCNTLASAVAMNKHICKRVVSDLNIPVLPSVRLAKDSMLADAEQAVGEIFNCKELGDRYFVKPVNLGSSIGVGKALDKKTLYESLARAFKYDREVLVEKYLDHMREVNISIFSDIDGLKASLAEVPVASKDTLTYEDKYLRGAKNKGVDSSGGMASLTRELDPSYLESNIKDEIRDYAQKIYSSLGCSGVVRFDFYIDLDTDTIYFNELNAVPGSWAFYLWEHSYLYTEIIDKIIEAAFRTYAIKLSVKVDLNFKALR